MTAHRAALAVTTGFDGISRADFRAPGFPQGLREASQPEPAGTCMNSIPPAQPSASCVLRPRPESVQAGRAFTRATLCGWGLPGLVDLAELVVSELVTNAVRHGVPSALAQVSDTSIRLRLLAQLPFVMCIVTDPGSGVPVLREPGPSAESGRGLNVVESCCARWGWYLLDEGGKVVWALLRPPS